MSLPNFSLEQTFWNRGLGLVGGMDEVGRGSFAGPLVAGLVCFPKKAKIPSVTINDSKKLSPKQRDIASFWIKRNSLWSVGAATCEEINNYGITPATNMAFVRALQSLQKSVKTMLDHLLIDGKNTQEVGIISSENQTRINRGDSLSMSIAAASIIAKVSRDNLMLDLSKNKRFRMYGWEFNKGYGTSAHRESIKTHGPCELHRTQFIRSYL